MQKVFFVSLHIWEGIHICYKFRYNLNNNKLQRMLSHKSHLCNPMMIVCCVWVHASLPTYVQNSPSSIPQCQGQISNCHLYPILPLSKVNCPPPLGGRLWSMLQHGDLLLQVALAHVEPVSASPACTVYITIMLSLQSSCTCIIKKPHPLNTPTINSMTSQLIRRVLNHESSNTHQHNLAMILELP